MAEGKVRLMARTNEGGGGREDGQAQAGPGLPDAARRALAEAEARRRAAGAVALPREIGGREGPEPVRYGDWERRGIAVDF
jgi:hypothetical protein